MSYDLYIDKILLPVAPEKITIRTDSQNKTINLINEGQAVIAKQPSLSVIEFESLLPAAEYPFARYADGFKTPSFYTDTLEKLSKNTQPFRFILTRTNPSGKVLSSLDMAVVMEDWKILENAANLCDVAVNIKLREYRAFSAKTVKISDGNAASSENRQPSTVRDVPIGIGSDVIVNGRLFKNSYGAEPGRTLTNYRGKINYINLKGSHPYHVTTPNGDWLGWVLASAVRAVT